jgi:hypothetical protein
MPVASRALCSFDRYDVRATGGSGVFEGFIVLLGGLLASLLPDRWAKRIAARFPSRRRGKHGPADQTE